MKDTSGDQSKLRKSVIAGLSLALMASLTAGCRGGTKPAANETSTVEAPNPPTPQPLPVATIAPVGRAELLAAAAAAADEFAAGNALPKANLELIDRTFELRLAFGCSRGMPGDWGEWSIDPTTRVLRISVRPALRDDNKTVKALGAGIDFDAAVGFWIERPWTRSEECPLVSSSALEPAELATDHLPSADARSQPQQTLAIVQYFSPDTPRPLQRGSRPYAYTGKAPENAGLATKGFRLRLAGRIRAFADGQPIHCVVAAADRPPICAAAVEINQVTFEDASTGQILANWNS